MRRALVPIDELRVFYHRRADERVLVGRLAYRERRALFEFDASFRALGLELSPYTMAVEDGLLSARPDRFEGLFGLFDDSLPDAWGRLLLDRHVEALGGGRAALTPLDRLAWIGDRAIGALSYEPSHPVAVTNEAVDLRALGDEMRIVLEDGVTAALEQLLRLGGSPQGARPKALVLVSSSGAELIAGPDHRDGFEPHLVKFPARSDPPSAGAIEFAYSQMAAAAGVAMPPTRLLSAGDGRPGVFAIRRFDRIGRARVHTHTLSGLLGAPPGVTFTTYDALLKVTFQLTKDLRQVAQVFRRAAFNVYAHNRDDHARNFAFTMDADGAWSLAPAYDVTYAQGPGGEHTMTIAGEGRNPGEAHLAELAKRGGLAARDAADIVQAVRAACAKWRTFADEAGVPAIERDRIGAALDRVSR